MGQNSRQSSHSSPLEKLRALPENKRHWVSIGAAAFVAVSVGFAQVTFRMNEDDASSKVAQNAPSAFEGLGNILEQGKSLMTGAVSNFKGLESSLGTSTVKLLDSSMMTASDSSTSSADVSMPAPVTPKKSIDITSAASN